MELWNKALEKSSVKKERIQNIKSLYSNIKNLVRVWNAISNIYHQYRKQGCILSPLLCNTIIDKVVKEFKKKEVG